MTVADKSVVAPGEKIVDSTEYIPGVGVYKRADGLYANRVGIVSIIGKAVKLTPLCGPYVAHVDDTIICQVSDITMNGWRLHTNTPHSAMLNVRDATNQFVDKGADLTKILTVGDYIIAKVIQVTTQNLLDVSLRAPGLKKLVGGQFMTISAHKFARIIGRNGSMVSLLKSATNCQILAGQNGIVWISGEPAMEALARNAIQLIDTYAHTSGLTDRVKAYLIERGAKIEEAHELS